MTSNSNASGGWSLCTTKDCRAVALGGGLPCVVHATEQDLEAAVADGPLVLRGAHIDRALAMRIYARLPVVADAVFKDEQRRVLAADLTDAVFQDDVDFSSIILSGCCFIGATFKGTASWQGVRFEGNTSFNGAVFERTVWFDGATFADTVILDGATFRAAVHFDHAHLEGLQSRQTTFAATAWFVGATLGCVSFHRAIFKDVVFLNDATFEGACSFSATTFESALGSGRAIVRGLLDMSDVIFLQKVTLDLDGGHLFFRRTRFTRGGTLQLNGSEIALDEAEFGGPVVLVAREGRARVLSLCRADLTNLVLVGTDLAACRFAGAVGRHLLRMEGDIRFATGPGWTRRDALAEEHEWRASPDRGTQWYKRTSPDRRTYWNPPQCRVPEWLQLQYRNYGVDSSQLRARQLADLYRSLRKGREDFGNEPGAADFYYGEMEMRRHDELASLAERAIIWLYCLTSGYGLRASRALASLSLTVVVFAVLLAAWGFRGADARIGLGGALIFSIESTTSLLRAPDRDLTSAGELLGIALRLLGPLFFGLMLLSLRGRVRR